MAGQTRRGQAQAKPRDVDLPVSWASLKRQVIGHLRAYRDAEALCWVERTTRRATGEDLFTVLDEGGERLTFDVYAAELKLREKLLKDATPPAVWRAALKELKEADRLNGDD